MPRKTGVDKKTLIEDNELFLFEDEVEPILSVLCGKTLELARMEVMQEEELNEMRRQQERLLKFLNDDNLAIMEQENMEDKRFKDF